MNPLSFLEWDDLESLNAQLCGKAGYQHGRTSDGYAGAKAIFDASKAKTTFALDEVVDLFRELHRKQPFLFLNGNTFVETGRNLTTWVRGAVNAETRSRIGHHIAGTEVMTPAELKELLSTEN